MLRRLLLPLAVGISLAVAAAGYAGTSTSTSTGLVGEVGPGYTIEVMRNGKDLKTIKAGTYKVKVEDKSSSHNFHLIGGRSRSSPARSPTSATRMPCEA